MESAILASGVERRDDDEPRFLSSTHGLKVTPHQWIPRVGSFVSPLACMDDETDNLPCDLANRICLNICGQHYEVPADVFAKHPTTLLGDPNKIKKFFDPVRNEYYFDRNRACFEAILSYYQSGQLHRPQSIPLKSFIIESKFFQLDKPALLQICEAEGIKPVARIKLPKNKLQRSLWLLVDDPQSSLAARLFSIWSLIVIAISVIVLCLSSLPEFRYYGANATAIMADAANNSDIILEDEILAGYEQFHDPLWITSTVCIVWFTVEFLLRLGCCPDKKMFFKSAINIIDLVAILPYYIDLAVTLVGLSRGVTGKSKAGIMGILRILRIIRIFRVVKLSRYSRGLQLLGETFLISVRELGLLLLFLGIGVVLFSCAIFYAEIGINDSQFTSIPESFWWAIVTMTTVGYGDVAPKGVYGKIVGACCAISGLMAIALPVPVIVSNFNTLYMTERQRSEIEELLGDILGIRPMEGEVEETKTDSGEKRPRETQRQNTILTTIGGSFDEMLDKLKPQKKSASTGSLQKDR